MTPKQQELLQQVLCPPLQHLLSTLAFLVQEKQLRILALKEPIRPLPLELVLVCDSFSFLSVDILQGIGGCLLISAGIAAVFILLKRRKKQRNTEEVNNNVQLQSLESVRETHYDRLSVTGGGYTTLPASNSGSMLSPTELKQQNVSSNNDWQIPYDELKIGEKVGEGAYGDVYKAKWGGVAVAGF